VRRAFAYREETSEREQHSREGYQTDNGREDGLVECEGRWDGGSQVSCANDQAAGVIVILEYAWTQVLYAWTGVGTHKKAGHLVSSIPIVAVLTGVRAWRGVTVGCAGCGVAHAGFKW
jgi:hypothetical protein